MNKPKAQKGFTVLEMVVVITIITIVSSILAFGFKNYGARLHLRRNAEEVALAIREAQAYALAVRGINDGGVMKYTSWGINFDKSFSTSQFRMFVDTYSPSNPPTKEFDNGQDQLVKTFTLSNGVKILNLAKGLETDESDNSSINRLDILYQRPNPDTTLKADGTRCSGLVISNDLTSGTCPDVEIILQGIDGHTRTVVVWSTGQITVK